jgi:chromosomal replication initiation ATPase DnaA
MISKILQIVSKEYSNRDDHYIPKIVTIDMILKKGRSRSIAEARQVCHYFAKKKTNYTLERIGQLIGKKDHATVMYSIKNVERLKTVNKLFSKRLENIEKQLEYKLPNITEKEKDEAIIKGLCFLIKKHYLC